MSTAVIFPLPDGSGLDMLDPEFADVTGIVDFSVTPTTVVVDFGDGETDTFLGSGFTSTPFGLTGGTVTGIEYRLQSSLVARATGLDIPAVTLSELYVAGQGEAVVERLFGGADDVTGSAASERLSLLSGDDTVRGGAGNDTLLGEEGADVLDGGAGRDSLEGGPGNDVFLGSEGADVLSGGPGMDRLIFPGSALIDPNDTDPRNPLPAPDGAVRPELGANGPSALDTPGARQTLSSIERIELDDATYLYDLAIGAELASLYARIESGQIGETERIQPVGDDLATVYRLYGAAYGRTPDEAGLRFWAERYANGEIAQRQLAEAFITVPEFEFRYDGDPDMAGFQEPTDEEYISLLYDNALRRELDQSGFEFWVEQLESGAFDRVEMLIFFADSPENITRTRPYLEDGVVVLSEDDAMV